MIAEVIQGAKVIEATFSVAVQHLIHFAREKHFRRRGIFVVVAWHQRGQRMDLWWMCETESEENNRDAGLTQREEGPRSMIGNNHIR